MTCALCFWQFGVWCQVSCPNPTVGSAVWWVHRSWKTQKNGKGRPHIKGRNGLTKQRLANNTPRISHWTSSASEGRVVLLSLGTAVPSRTWTRPAASPLSHGAPSPLTRLQGPPRHSHPQPPVSSRRAFPCQWPPPRKVPLVCLVSSPGVSFFCFVAGPLNFSASTLRPCPGHSSLLSVLGLHRSFPRLDILRHGPRGWPAVLV